MDVFKKQTRFYKYFTRFVTYENSSFHTLENLIILFKKYVFQTKMRSSRPRAMVLKDVWTIRLYIEQFLLLKNATNLTTTIIWRFCFKTCNVHHQQILFFNFILFFLFSFLLSPSDLSLLMYIDLYIPKMYFHDYFMFLHIQKYYNVFWLSFFSILYMFIHQYVWIIRCT